MFAVRGIYDGKKVKITDRISEKKRYRVVVTFIEELPLEENEIRDFASQTESFDFWENKAEDIYQDYLIQKPDKK
jgi:hypothetical protein